MASKYASWQVPRGSEDKDYSATLATRAPDAENDPSAANMSSQPGGGHTKEEVAVTAQSGALAVMQLIAAGDLFAGTALPLYGPILELAHPKNTLSMLVADAEQQWLLPTG